MHTATLGQLTPSNWRVAAVGWTWEVMPLSLVEMMPSHWDKATHAPVAGQLIAVNPFATGCTDQVAPSVELTMPPVWSTAVHAVVPTVQLMAWICAGSFDCWDVQLVPPSLLTWMAPLFFMKASDDPTR